MHYSKKSIQSAIAMFAVLTFASCKTDKVIAPEVSALSVVNAAVGSPALDVKIGQNKASNDLFTYGKDISYLNVYSGEREVSFFQGTEKNTTGKFTLKNGKYYSLFLVGEWPQTELVLLNDSLTRPASGKAHIRFVNMSKDAGVLNLGLTNGSTLINQKAYKIGSDFIEVNGNKPYTFVIRNHTTLTDTLSIPAVNLESGRIYTIWAKGLKAQTGTKSLDLAVIKNN